MDQCCKPPLQMYLAHHGIKGQKWGVRRYQNRDGTWTAAGRKRYDDGDGEPDDTKAKTSSGTKKKVAIGVATTAAVVTGTVLTAYLVKKYGRKNITYIADKTSASKDILQDVLKSTSVAETPVSQIPTLKVEPKQVLEQVAKSASSATSSVSQISTPRVSVSKPPSGISSPYSFKSLMRENDDLLKKMLAELA